MLLYFIRHGQTDWNREKRIMGRSPVPINDIGKERVLKTAEFLSDDGIDMIYSGTLKRTKQTADIFSNVWGVNIQEDSRLDESPFQQWVGKRYKELKGDPDFKLYTAKPSQSNFSENEDMSGIRKRVTEFVKEIEQKENKKAAIISHSDVIKPALTYFLRMDLDMMHRITIENASVTLVAAGDIPRVLYMNLVPWRIL
ncbi:histidine phosphatase family protein [bacterium]|nr:histidine phosphatase family protein [bacterium]